jgi:hypothetical protein
MLTHGEEILAELDAINDWIDTIKFAAVDLGKPRVEQGLDNLAALGSITAEA